MPQIQCVVRNKQAIGFLLNAGRRGYRAFDQDGLLIGLFEDEERAAKAVYDEAAPVETNSRGVRLFGL